MAAADRPGAGGGQLVWSMVYVKLLLVIVQVANGGNIAASRRSMAKRRRGSSRFLVPGSTLL